LAAKNNTIQEIQSMLNSPNKFIHS